MPKKPPPAIPYPMYFTSQSDMAGKSSSTVVRMVSLIRKGMTPL